jgi:hypothetical protein
VDLGLRYEAYSPLTPRNAGGAQVFNPFTNTLGPVGPGSNNLQNWDTDAIAPRVGLAYRITERTVIRAGYGLFYFQTPITLSGYMPTQYGFFNGIPRRIHDNCTL